MKYLFIFLFATTLNAQQKATASWNANTESDLAGYKLYIGTSSGNYDFNVYDIGDGLSHTVDEPFEFDKRYYFAVTAYDLAGNESLYSIERSLVWPKPDNTAPKAPDNFILILFNENSSTTIRGKVE